LYEILNIESEKNPLNKEKKTMTMPTVNTKNIENLSDEETKIFNVVVKKNNTIRATKPKVNRSNTDIINGKASYVWRMVAFMVSPKPAHQCMPACASFDLPAFDENGDWKSPIARIMENELQKLIDVIIDNIDKSQWHGVHRWGRALGY